MLSALGLVVLLGACTGGATPTTTEATSVTTGETSSTVPDLTPGELAQLQARALHRAWTDFAGSGPPCIGADTSAELRAAIAGVFDGQVEYFEPSDLYDDSGNYRCSHLVLNEMEWVSAAVVRISAGVIYGYLAGQGLFYYFRWDGTGWIDSEPDPGVTTTFWAS